MPNASNNNPFKDCDIRGKYPSEVHERLFQSVGYRLGGAVANAKGLDGFRYELIVAGDARPTTQGLKESLFAGLAEHDIPILDLGVVPTPVTYWTKARRRSLACAIVTASHNPPDWNGLKVMIGGFPPTPDCIQQLAVPADEFISQTSAKATNIQILENTVDDYCTELIESRKNHGIDKLKIVLDPGNGLQTLTAPRVFDTLGAELVIINGRLDGTYPDRHPDSAPAKNLTALSQAVLQEKANLGFAFDGDGDRINVVDNRGRVLGAERLTMLLMQGPLKPAPDQSVILDIKCSMQLERLALACGGRPERCKSGHAYMKQAVLEKDACFGIELSGHLFWGQLEGRDDPLYTALLLAEQYAKSDKSLADTVDALMPMLMTPDIRIPARSDEIDRILTRCEEGIESSQVETLDGVRLVWEDGWLVVRRSITEPKFTLRLEGDSEDSLHEVGERFLEVFPQYRQEIEDAIRSTLQ